MLAKLGCAHLYTWLAYHAYAPAYTRLYCAYARSYFQAHAPYTQVAPALP